MTRYSKPHPNELPDYIEGRTYSDYHPIRKDEIAKLLTLSQDLDDLTRGSIQARFLQAIPGATWGPQRKPQAYNESAYILKYLFATYARIWGATPLLVQQIYDLTHPE